MPVATAVGQGLAATAQTPMWPMRDPASWSGQGPTAGLLATMASDVKDLGVETWGSSWSGRYRRSGGRTRAVGVLVGVVVVGSGLGALALTNRVTRRLWFSRELRQYGGSIAVNAGRHRAWREWC
jgi:hypothetical protein